MLDSLYIHVPFCAEKCDYCAFYSLPTVNVDLQRAYLKGLVAELNSKKNSIGRLRSIFMGGGTPSTLEHDILCDLFRCINDLFELAEDCEISMECNPSSLTPSKLKTAMACGVNRISLGIQSFQEDSRESIGRQGHVKYTRQALDLLVSSDIKNFNCDLIYALPDQTLKQWEQDLEELIAYKPTHVSAYSLMFEEGTPLTRRAQDNVDEELYLDMWHAAESILGRIGLTRYEISNYSKKGHRCRHNWEIWHGRPFAAVGPAAHSFDGRVRRANVESLQGWLKGSPAREDVLSPEDRAVEILIIGLRTCEGWPRTEFHQVTDYDFMELRGERIQELVTAGLLDFTDDVLKPTERGLLLNNYVGERLL